MNAANILSWQLDAATQAAVQKYPLMLHSEAPKEQYQGHQAAVAKLRLGTDGAPDSPYITCSPARIIEDFTAGRYLSGIALTISWGGMDRTKNLYVYRSHTLERLQNSLEECAQSIKHAASIEKSWEILTRGLYWSNVMTSKTLHFLCRPLNFANPPVPIDKERVLKHVWPRFSEPIPLNDRPLGWAGNEFAAYSRYMTFILELRTLGNRNWTTTQVESTITAEVDSSK